MSMRTHRLATHLQAAEALALIEFLDQLRDVLMQSYENEIRTMLKEAGREQCCIRPEDAQF